jgi:hypothetical protein
LERTPNGEYNGRNRAWDIPSGKGSPHSWTVTVLDFGAAIMANSSEAVSRRDLLILGGLTFGGGVLATATTADAASENAVEHHPHIRHAIEALRKAEKDLKGAAHDFGGHRVKAIESINHTIGQLELCMKFDKK